MVHDEGISSVTVPLELAAATSIEEEQVVIVVVVALAALAVQVRPAVTRKVAPARVGSRRRGNMTDLIDSPVSTVGPPFFAE
jgi:hypothetical protein